MLVARRPRSPSLRRSLMPNATGISSSRAIKPYFEMKLADDLARSA